MRDLLFGIETEYALAGVDARGMSITPGLLAGDFIDIASADLPHLLNKREGDLFLQNGSRLYIDCGSHPEMATPECLDPWDVVRFVRAGDRIVTRLASRVRDVSHPDDPHRPGGRVMVFRSNVDYTGMETTWGCHESYLQRSPLSEMFEHELIPHLVSRIIFSGAGGFNPLRPGLAFTLSPRAAYVTMVRSRESTGQRGILHHRHEPLARGAYERLHVMFGESLCSDMALWLKVGSTALVAAVIDADPGQRPFDAVQLTSPLSTLSAFAADPTCRVKVALRNGRTASALELQRYCLAQVESHRGAMFMPPWANEVCARWREMLDRLERGPASVSTCLDWAIKRALYIDYAARRGFSWDALTEWSTLAESGGGGGRAAELAKLRQELFEIDMRFGQLGQQGIFDVLDRAGVLGHRIEGIGDGDIERAVESPPVQGRAKVRGNAVKRLSSEAGRYVCDWTGIFDRDLDSQLDLGDPFVEQECWRSAAEGGTAWARVAEL